MLFLPWVSPDVVRERMTEQRRLRLMRLALTRATAKYTMGGRVKTQGNKPVTLPTLRSAAMMEGRSHDGPVYCYHEDDFWIVVDADGHKYKFAEESAAVAKFRELTRR